MIPALLLPLGLAALAALAVPLVIHIARRSEQLPTDFAALRWLRQKPRPRQRLRFDEWLLLTVRLVLLTLVALWLARPVVFGAENKRPVVAVMPGLVPAEEASAIPPDATTVWLAPAFPSLDEPAPKRSVNFPSLLRELDAKLPPAAKLYVIVPETLQGADAERPRLSRPVDWKIVPGAMPAAPSAAQALPTLALHADDVHAASLRYFRALATAWQKPAPSCSPSRLRQGVGGWAPAIIAREDAAGSPSPTPPASGKGEDCAPPAGSVLIWLTTTALPHPVTDWVAQGGTALVAADTPIDRTALTPLWRDPIGAPLVEARAAGRGRLLRFTRPLAPAEMPQLLDGSFPAAMAGLLAAPAPPPARVDARDYTPVTGAAAPTPPARDLQPGLALLIAAVFLAERWLATARRRGVAP
jgi:hypothetical protein